ncbi:Gag protein [Phytophthora palmivora]|uniref:Gag protein n=1 Tax=Phytophthora palmivora TaxID=4796 RepID=A0A2P4XI85_9STRA|nr:Gag protein [Phytophthora palmivora]
MGRGEFTHLTDAQVESARKMAGIFGGDTLRSLAAATPAEHVESIKTYTAYRSHAGLQAPVAELKRALSRWGFNGKEGENLHFCVREVELHGCGFHLDRATPGRFRPIQPGRSSEDLGEHARGDNAGLLHNLSSAVRTA